MTSKEARHLTRYLREHRVCKPFSKAALDRGTKIEHREHPGFTKTEARKIARDHLCAKGARAYPTRRGFGDMKWWAVAVLRSRGAGGVYARRPIELISVSASSPDSALSAAKTEWEAKNPPRAGRRWAYEIREHSGWAKR